jgi:hypothetical protein
LLDEAQFTIMNFIKGPVCRGNVALGVIQNRFWVFFTSPQSPIGEEVAQFLSQEKVDLKLPAASESGLLSVVQWRSYAKAQERYLEAKGDFIRKHAAALQTNGLKTFWDGDGHNPNAALTVFRHYDSATVAQGLVGSAPQTAWLIDYPILERIHYLLVAGFDVYGTASHQAMTRMYMDFLRMEAEMNFIGFLPQRQREYEVDQWYRGAEQRVRTYLDSYYEHGVLMPLFQARTEQPKQELFGVLQERMANVLNRRYQLESSGLSSAAIASLAELNQVRGVPASIMPQVMIIKVKEHGLLTVLSNSAYTNIAFMFGEDRRRLIEEDSLTVTNGVLGAYPNMFLQLSESEVPEFVSRVKQLRTEADYSELLDRFGMRRTDERFWPLSDQILSDYRQAEPLTAGVLDYSRYENR